MPAKINDGLTAYQRYKLKHPERFKESKNKSERKQWASKSPEERIEIHLKKRYRLTYQQWIQMFEDQDYKCKTCGSQVEATQGNTSNHGVVDHCHTSGTIRGILCHNCNRALGLINDSKETLKKMLEYLNV